MAEVGGGQPWEQLKLTWERRRNAPRGMVRGAGVTRGSLAYFSSYGSHDVFGYNPEKDDWIKLPECPQIDFGLAVINDTLTAVGGEVHGQYTNCLSSFSGGKWVTVFPPMPTKRGKPAVISAQNYLITIGGYRVGGYLSTVEVMDMNTLEWYTAASLPEPVSSMSATVCGGRLYLLGGYDKYGKASHAVFTCTLDSLIRLFHPPSQTTPHTNEASVWKRVADVPVVHSTCTTLNETVLAVDGMDSYGHPTPAVHMYNPESDLWLLLGSMTTAQYYCLVVGLRDCIIAVGGYTLSGFRGHCATVDVGYLQLSGQLEPTSKSKHLFNEAMKEGRVRSRNTVTVFVGAAGTGKTCSKHVLMNENPPEVRVSTPMAERPVKAMKILTIDGLKWRRLSPDDQKEILATFMVNIPGEASDTEASDTEAFPIMIVDEANAMHSSSEAPHGKSFLTQSSEAPHGKSLSAQSSGAPHGKSISSKQAEEISPSTPKDDPTSIAESAKIEQVNTLLESSTSESEFARLIELLSGTEAPPEVSLVYLTDSGGQPQFHEVLPIFLRRTSVYIFVMKLSESLDEQPLVEYFDDNGNVICKPYTAAHTNMQILRHCIRTMQSHKFQKAAGKAPNLVFIGTHKDQEHLCPETREVKNQKLAEMLLPEFQDEVVYSDLVKRELIFPLNAKSPGEKEQEVAKKICNIIMSVCTAEPDEIPLRWYCLELKLQEIAQALGRGVMSKDECFAVARTLHFDTESFEAALQYLDELNIIFYYPDILPNTVFTDSQVLIAKASELVKFSHKLRNKDAGSLVVACGGEYGKFQDYASVTVGFLRSFNEHYVDNIFTPNDLVKLFRALLVFADFGNKEYFMPCLLQIISPEDVAKHQVNSSAATVPLILRFPAGIPPLGIFCSLVVYLLSASNRSPSPWKLKLDHSKKSPVCLHRNCVEFAIENYPGTITLIDSFDFFEVHISTQLCSLVREALLTGLERVISNLGYSCKPELAFLCPCPRKGLHPASIGEDGSCWICTRDSETFGSIDERQQLWLSTSATGSRTARPRIGLDLESVDGTTVLDEDDLHDVRSAVADLTGRWQDLGVSLGIHLGDLEAIYSAGTHSPSDCLRKVLSLWLRQSYKVERFRKPTWRRLVEAVEDHVGGNNFALAQTISRKHPALPSPHPPTSPSATRSEALRQRRQSGRLSHSYSDYSRKTSPRERPLRRMYLIGLVSCVLLILLFVFLTLYMV